MELQEIIAAAVPVLIGLLEGLRRGIKKHKETKARRAKNAQVLDKLEDSVASTEERDARDSETHAYVTNHLVHAVERIEGKLDRVGERLDDHIEAHKERNRE